MQIGDLQVGRRSRLYAHLAEVFRSDLVFVLDSYTWRTCTATPVYQHSAQRISLHHLHIRL